MGDVIYLDLPLLKLSDVENSTAGLRPYRKGGIRFEVESLRYLTTMKPLETKLYSIIMGMEVQEYL